MIELATKREALLAIACGVAGLMVVCMKVSHYLTVRRLEKEMSDFRKEVGQLTTPEAVVNFRRKQNGLPPRYDSKGNKII